jgi:hypothetical protein
MCENQYLASLFCSIDLCNCPVTLLSWLISSTSCLHSIDMPRYLVTDDYPYNSLCSRFRYHWLLFSANLAYKSHSHPSALLFAGSAWDGLWDPHMTSSSQHQRDQNIILSSPVSKSETYLHFAQETISFHCFNLEMDLPGFTWEGLILYASVIDNLKD